MVGTKTERWSAQQGLECRERRRCCSEREQNGDVASSLLPSLLFPLLSFLPAFHQVFTEFLLCAGPWDRTAGKETLGLVSRISRVKRVNLRAGPAVGTWPGGASLGGGGRPAMKGLSKDGRRACGSREGVCTGPEAGRLGRTLEAGTRPWVVPRCHREALRSAQRHGNGRRSVRPRARPAGACAAVCTARSVLLKTLTHQERKPV